MIGNKKIIAVAVIVAIIAISSITYYVFYYAPSEEIGWEDTLVIGTTQTMVNPDPNIGASTGLDHSAFPLYGDSLFWSPEDSPGEIRGQLAEEYCVKWEDIDGESKPYLQVKLREGLHFNDGTEITADSFVLTHKRRLELDPTAIGVTAWCYNYDEFGNDTWIAVDKYTIKTRIPTSFPLIPIALNGMSCTTWPNISPDAVEKYGEGLEVAKYGLSGPLVLTEFVPNEKIVFEVREDYKDPETGGWVPGMGKADEVWPPKWERVVVRIYADSSALTLALKNGEIDISIGKHSKTEIKELMDDDSVDVQSMPGGCVRGLNLNVGHPPLDNMKVRKAIFYALDPSQNIETVKLGLAEPSYSNVGPYDPYYIPAVQEIYDLHGSRNLTKARELLAEAGYSEGFETDYMVAGHYASLEEEKMDAQIIQSQLADVNITVNIVIQDSGTWKQWRIEGKTPIHMRGFYPDYPDPDNDFHYMTMHGVQWGAPMLANNTEFPDYRYNEVMDMYYDGLDLWDPDISYEDNEERRDLYNEMQTIVAEDTMVYVPYYIESGFICSKDYVKNLDIHWFYMNLATPGIFAAYKESQTTAQQVVPSGISVLPLVIGFVSIPDTATRRHKSE